MMKKVFFVSLGCLSLALGFVMMSRVPVGRIILGIVWAGHILYFGFVVKTISQEEADAAVASAQEE